MAEELSKSEIFDDEIPNDLIKKKGPPLKLILVGSMAILILIGLVAFTFYDKSHKKKKPHISTAEANSSVSNQRINIPNFASVAKAAQQAEASLDRSEDKEDEPKIPKAAPVGQGSELPPPAPSSDTKINVLDTPSNDTKDASLKMPAPESGNTSDAIVIRPPASKPAPIAKTENIENSKPYMALKSRLDELQSEQETHINIVKSGMELQSQGITKLNSLLGKLDNLTRELNTLAAQTKQVEAKAHTHHHTAKAISRNSHTLSTKHESKPKDHLADTTLLGIDIWGGERFAQIEYQGKIHLLAVNEFIDNWRVVTINSENVTLKNNTGETVELTKD